VVQNNIFTCPDCGSINLAALRHFRDQADNLRELEAMLSRIQQELDPPDVEVAYFVTPNGSHFHRLECRWIEDVPHENLTEFYSHKEAVEADYKPCKTCRS
jgi:hypothetical protein